MKQILKAGEIQAFFPKAERLSEWDPRHGGQNVFDGTEKKLGHVIQTSPEADQIYGFSGPTNTMIAYSAEKKILGISVLRSDDTREHLAAVLKDEAYLAQWNNLDSGEAIALRDIDAVSGATLTSTAIADGISRRLGGREKKSRFPEKITIEEVRPFLKEADSFAPIEKKPFLQKVLNADAALIGYASRTSPHADYMIGYQGPIDVLIIQDLKERVSALAIRSSFENKPFVSYVREDEYFFNTFKGFTLDEIAQIDVVDAQIDGVSGATKTSITVAEGLIESAFEINRIREPVPPKPLINFKLRDVGTILVVLFAMLIAFTRLRGKRWLRIAFQILLVIYLGFINADMVSQALLIGWSKTGIAWQVAPGLVFLTAATLLSPIFSGRQVYCTHICPYGAAQDLLARRIPFQISVRGKWEKMLSCIPVVLLVWCLVIAMGHLRFSLVALEPFDAFVFQIAGWVSISIAVIGLIASLFINRAYCRYGCPTGAMLKFLRFGGTSSEHLGRRDFIAAALALLSIALLVWR